MRLCRHELSDLTRGRLRAVLAESLALRALSAYRLPAGDVVADIGGADGTILEELFASAGFRLDQIIQTPTPLPILEATLTQT
jgi:hypothetical protein